MSDVVVARPALEPLAVFSPAAPSTSDTCQNCAAELVGPFCAQCGQRGTPGRLTLRLFATEFFAQIAQLDHGLLHTFVSLLRRPGPTIRAYIGGRRRPYSPPVTFLLLSIGFVVLRNQLIHEEGALASAERVNLESIKRYTAAQRAMLEHMFVFLDDHRSLFVVATIVPVVLLLRFFFRKQRLNLAEITTFACYTLGTATFLKLLMALPLDLTHHLTVVARPLSLVLVAYVLYAGLDFFGRSFSTAWRFAVAALVGLVSMFVAASIVVRFIA